MKIAIIGAGFGGLGAACLLAKAGHQVAIFEKNEQVGGRAGRLETEGFSFDTGPSWYLMPDVFERFFAELGEKTEDHFELIKLQPGYRVFSHGTEPVDIHSDQALARKTFEAIEPGAGLALEQYLQQAKYAYGVAMEHFLYKNFQSKRAFLNHSLLLHARKLNMLSNMNKHVARYFDSQQLRQIMVYPSVFLGANPYNTPALYGLLNHALFNQGIYYPKGGIYEVTKALERIAATYGVKIHLNSPVEKIIVKNGQAAGVTIDGRQHPAAAVISNTDPYFTEQVLLEEKLRDHSTKYWQSRTLAPSALLMYLGVNRQYGSLLHHNLLFGRDWQQNFREIFEEKQWPSDPSLYVCAPSKTDPTVAPAGKENLFVLVPVAAGLDYTDKQLERYADKILGLIEKEMKLPDLRQNIAYKKLFCVKDFAGRFNSYNGTGLGLAHTLRQTAVFRPGNKSRKVKNLYYVGANVHPGIGLPTCLISAQLAFQRVNKKRVL